MFTFSEGIRHIPCPKGVTGIVRVRDLKGKSYYRPTIKAKGRTGARVRTMLFQLTPDQRQELLHKWYKDAERKLGLDRSTR